MANLFQKMKSWASREETRARARALREDVNKAFTDHPNEAGETYLEHLLFTAGIALRFFYASTVILIHGIFPFLLTRTASQQTEAIYRIMKTRIPKDRRQAIDEMDYCV